MILNIFLHIFTRYIRHLIEIKNMGKVSDLKNICFYDGLKRPIDKERILKFEKNAIYDRYYSGRVFDHTTLIEDLGTIQIDFTNIHDWLQELPDIDSKSGRIFSLYAEDIDTKSIVVIIHGYIILVPFGIGKAALKEYYYQAGVDTYYPIAIISSLRTTISTPNILVKLLDRIEQEVNIYWKRRKIEIIELLKEGDLWKRYINSFDDIIHYYFLCPSIDRELVFALKQREYKTQGNFQLLSNTTASYDDAMINDHLKRAKRLSGL